MSASEPWPVDLLTTEYVISGDIAAPAREWAWAYFQPVEKGPARTLDVEVSAAAATGARQAPPLAGTLASFGFGTALVAVIPRGPATLAIWEEWNGKAGGVPAEVLVGPYALVGSVATPDGTLGSAMLNSVLAVRDATVTRIDGAGAAAPIAAPRAIVATGFVHTGAVAR